MSILCSHSQSVFCRSSTKYPPSTSQTYALWLETRNRILWSESEGIFKSGARDFAASHLVFSSQGAVTNAVSAKFVLDPHHLSFSSSFHLYEAALRLVV